MMRTRGEKIFSVFNTIILSLIALACLIPVWHVICCSDINRKIPYVVL